MHCVTRRTGTVGQPPYGENRPSTVSPKCWKDASRAYSVSGRARILQTRQGSIIPSDPDLAGVRVEGGARQERRQRSGAGTGERPGAES